MIGYLRGELVELNEGRLLVGVGSASGMVGYSVQVPRSPEYALLRVGAPIELFIHTHVREDDLDLHGFLTRGEKALYLLLLKVKGVGPKAGMAILSGGTVAGIVRAIAERDQDFLTSIPGVGKKTAEQVKLDLSDSMKKRLDAGEFGGSKALYAHGSGAVDARDAKGGFPVPSILRDAREALLGLGYRENEIMTLLQRVMEDEASAPKRVEDLVRTALRQLST